MKHNILRLSLLALFPCVLLGCDVFDETLIPPDEPAEPAGQPELLFGDQLSANLPANASYRADYHDPISFQDFQDNSSVLPECLDGVDSPGTDIFFKVDMKQGQKWHFHVLSSSMPAHANPAIYVLNSVFEPNRACGNKLSGINACPGGSPEHFSFVADETQSYYIGVDELDGVNEEMKIFAVNAECGNGFKEHSEYCDPTAATPGPVDDCEDCRKVLQDGGDDDSMENSFNDGPLDATILKIPSGSTNFDFAFQGKISTSCDFDFYRFHLDSPARVTAELDHGDADVGCLKMDVEFWDDPGDDPFKFGNVSEDCQPKTVDLVSGDHWIRVAGRPDVIGADRPTYIMHLNFEPR